MNYIILTNNSSVPFGSIPVTDYEVFMDTVLNTLMRDGSGHCVNYYGIRTGNGIQLICCIADDMRHTIRIASTLVSPTDDLPSLTAHQHSFEKFEREIHENFGVGYTDHPWLKPVRYPFDRADQERKMDSYPFYTIAGEELHETGVGPIHAGIIEPGHFRFICNGEQILHLEIQLGYQHRGIEDLFLRKKNLNELMSLSESIAGDTAVGHSLCFVNLWESLCGFVPSEGLKLSRTIASEHERIAIHTGDLGALCTDIAYQLGASVFGRLRTPLINYFQIWCGNRLAKGLIRPGRTNFPFTRELADAWKRMMDEYEPDFHEMAGKLFDLPSALARFERTGIVPADTAREIGAVGLTARASGLNRDIRISHPYDLYEKLDCRPLSLDSGDVYARAKLREMEIDQSAGCIKELLKYEVPGSVPAILSSPLKSSFAISLTEGWRGEICHCAVTDDCGDLLHYKIKDPSFHNWLALALAVRNNEISDFPVCNKSFNLSYCGHDL